MGSATQEMTTSDISASSRGVAASFAPRSTSGFAFAGVRFHTASGNPLSRNWPGHAAAHETEAGESDALRHDVSLPASAPLSAAARGIIILSALSVSEKRATFTSTRPAVGP